MLVRNFYIKDIANLAGPVILGNLGFILIGVGDVVVAGRHSTDTLAAVSIATSIINCIVMLGIGMIPALSAILSNYRGEGKNPQKYFYPSLKFSMLLAFITSLLILACIPVIDKIGFEQNLVPMIKSYFFITAFSTFGAFLHCMTKEFLQAFEIVIFPNLLTVFCIFLNVALNIIFAFGYGCIPEMGVAGLALASLITRYFMGIVQLIYCYFRIEIKPNKENNLNYYKDLIKVGFPASLAIMIEFVGFNAITIIMGRVSGIYAAAHNIMCTFTSVSFMIPLAISTATAVKVGFANGARYFKSLKSYAFTGMWMSVIFMAFSALIIGLFPEQLVRLFTNDDELVKVCVPIVYVLCFFQLFDGLQVALAGIYRGIKQTKVVMISNFISYWLISIPVGYCLAFVFHWNLFGFWCSLAGSAVILCTIMLMTLLKKFAKLEDTCRTSL